MGSAYCLHCWPGDKSGAPVRSGSHAQELCDRCRRPLAASNEGPEGFHEDDAGEHYDVDE